MNAARGLLFDVFGTLVDWRSSISRQAEDILAPLGLSTSWEGFADRWRAEYQPALEEVRSGREPYLPLDQIHRRTLEKVLLGLNVTRLDEAILNTLTLVWHRLEAWPDAREGLRRLHSRFRIAPCSNANVSLLVDLSRHNDWEWDAIAGAELARDFKPKPAVYLRSAQELGSSPGETIMVAAHPLDLRAARDLGMRTAFLARPHEHGTGRAENTEGMRFDWSASSLTDLADQLGCAT